MLEDHKKKLLLLKKANFFKHQIKNAKGVNILKQVAAMLVKLAQRQEVNRDES